MATLLDEGTPVHGIVYRGHRYDTGMPLGYLQAVVQLASKRDDLGQEFRQWLADFVSSEAFGGRNDMTATADAEAAANELTPLADYLGSVLRRLRALPPLDLDLTQAHGNVLAEDVLAPHPYPAFDQAAIDGYAARWEDLAGRPGAIGSHPSVRPRSRAGPRPVRLNVVGDLGAASWRPVRLTPGTCFSVAAGSPLPIGADVVVPVHWTDQGMAAVEILHAPETRVRRAARR